MMKRGCRTVETGLATRVKTMWTGVGIHFPSDASAEHGPAPGDFFFAFPDAGPYAERRRRPVALGNQTCRAFGPGWRALSWSLPALLWMT